MSAGTVNTSTSSVGEFWGGLPAIIKIIAIVTAITGAFFGGRAIWKGWKQRKRENALNNSTFTGTTGNDQALTVDLGAKAQEIYDCFHDNDWFGATEDEDGAIAAISGVPKSLIPDLKDTYKILSDGKDLKSEFITYLSADDYKRVAPLFV